MATSTRVDTLMEFVGVITVPAGTEKFVARDKFVVDTSGKAEVKIAYLGNNFLECFSDKKEDPAGESTLRCQRLRRAELDGPIIAALGGKKKAEITLGELYGFLKQADKNKWFICYIYDKDGLLRAVDAYWYGDGCHLLAYSVEDPYRWNEGLQVLSRNS